MNYKKILKEIENDEEIYREFKSFSENSTLAADILLWHFINDDRSFDRGKCEACGSKTQFINFKWGYKRFCSRTCANKSNTPKRIKTIQKKWGGKSPLQHPEIQEKARQTLKEKYGHENFAKTFTFKNRIRKNAQSKYGVDHHNQIPENKSKIKKGMLVKWGKDNVFKHPIIKQRALSTLREKYGVENPKYIHLDSEVIDYMHSSEWWREIFVDEGLTPKEIAGETGLSLSFVYQQLQQFGLLNEDQSGEYKSPDHTLFKPIF